MNRQSFEDFVAECRQAVTGAVFGVMGTVGIWDRQLSSEEIRRVRMNPWQMSSHRGLWDGLVDWWPMGEK